MKRSKHSGQHAVSCAACITVAETKRMPWHTDYVDTIERLPEIQRAHDKARRRAEREQAMRDLGLVKVKGGLGGTYWE